MQINGIDEKDNLIINLLLKDGRMSYSDIAEEVGLTRTAVKNRITNLENTGIIKGYRVIVNPLESSGMMPFVLNIETHADTFDMTKEKLVNEDETVTVVHTTGNCHLMAICISSDIKAMRIFINKVYNEIPGIRAINAQPVLDVLKGSVFPEK